MRFPRHLVLLVLVALSACAGYPSPPGSAGWPASTADLDHRRLVASYGGDYPDYALQAYLDGIVDRLARAAGTPPVRTTILDTPRVNAFAQDGRSGSGYLYVTRGLLALADSEAELASVLAHEMAHLIAEHPALLDRRIATARQTAAALETIADQETANAARAAAEVAVQTYSRAQELEADRLGLQIMVDAGYAASAAPDFLRKLRAERRLEAELRGLRQSEAPDPLSSHPPTREREERLAALIPTLTVNGGETGKAAYLAAIDGLIYGDEPAQGYVRGRSFLHPELRFAFEVPEGYWMLNEQDRVIALGPQGSLVIFEGSAVPAEMSTADFLTRISNGRFRGRPVPPVNGLETAVAEGTLRSATGPIDLRLVAYRMSDDLIYRFMMLTPQRLLPRLTGGLDKTADSFRRLSAAEAAALHPFRVRVRTVASGDTARRLAYDMATPTSPLQRFLILNGLLDGQNPVPGSLVKIIQQGAY